MFLKQKTILTILCLNLITNNLTSSSKQRLLSLAANTTIITSSGLASYALVNCNPQNFLDRSLYLIDNKPELLLAISSSVVFTTLRKKPSLIPLASACMRK